MTAGTAGHLQVHGGETAAISFQDADATYGPYRGLFPRVWPRS